MRACCCSRRYGSAATPAVMNAGLHTPRRMRAGTALTPPPDHAARARRHARAGRRAIALPIAWAFQAHQWAVAASAATASAVRLRHPSPPYPAPRQRYISRRRLARVFFCGARGDRARPIHRCHHQSSCRCPLWIRRREDQCRTQRGARIQGSQACAHEAASAPRGSSAPHTHAPKERRISGRGGYCGNFPARGITILMCDPPSWAVRPAVARSPPPRARPLRPPVLVLRAVTAVLERWHVSSTHCKVEPLRVVLRVHIRPQDKIILLLSDLCGVASESARARPPRRDTPSHLHGAHQICAFE